MAFQTLMVCPSSRAFLANLLNMLMILPFDFDDPGRSFPLFRISSSCCPSCAFIQLTSAPCNAVRDNFLHQRFPSSPAASYWQVQFIGELSQTSLHPPGEPALRSGFSPPVPPPATPALHPRRFSQQPLPSPRK